MAFESVRCADRKEASCIVNHSDSRYRGREDEPRGSELASRLPLRFTAVALQIVSLFNDLSSRLH